MHYKLIALPENMRFVILAVVLILWLILRVSQFLIVSRSSHSQTAPGEQRDYGLLGGAICPRCDRPVRLGLMSIKLGLGTRLMRCEYCGKWSVVRRASPEVLRAAEAAEAQPSESIQTKSEEEKLKDLMDNSRYTDQP